jgi:hypothetical protein
VADGHRDVPDGGRQAGILRLLRSMTGHERAGCRPAHRGPEALSLFIAQEAIPLSPSRVAQ